MKFLIKGWEFEYSIFREDRKLWVLSGDGRGWQRQQNFRFYFTSFELQSRKKIESVLVTFLLL